MGVSEDRPYLDIAYKLVSYDGRPTLKLSAEKVSLPGAKQVWRRRDGECYQGDVNGLVGGSGPRNATALLREVMTDGRRTADAEPLDEIRARCRDELARLPGEFRAIRRPARYPVRQSDALLDLQRDTTAGLTATT